MLFTRLLDSPSRLTQLDGPSRAVSDAVKRLPQPVLDLLHGTPFGHPQHPPLAMLPVGTWTSAALLDVMAVLSDDKQVRRGVESASSALVGVGVASAPVAALAGLADFSQLRPDQQRTGMVHAAGNSVALGLFGLSLLQRVRGRQGSGRVLGWAGAAVATGSAALGGHLAYRWTVGPNHAEHVPHVAPDGWHSVGRLEDLPEGEPAQRHVGEVSVAVVRRGQRVHALADTCSHLAGPLSQGQVVRENADECLVCPWHGSTFRLKDGAVVHGPAVAPQPRFDVRVEDGEVLLCAVDPAKAGV